MELPAPMPKVLEAPVQPEIEHSAPLSLMALPGDGGIATRKVAVLLAGGMDAGVIDGIQAALTKAGAVTRFLGARLGSIQGSDGTTIEADATLDNSPAVLFDGVVLPNGAASLATNAHAIEFVTHQYRHGKTIWAMGDAAALLEKAGVSTEEPDAGLLLSVSGAKSTKEFITALGRHRHPERDPELAA